MVPLTFKISSTAKAATTAGISENKRGTLSAALRSRNIPGRRVVPVFRKRRRQRLARGRQPRPVPIGSIPTGSAHLMWKQLMRCSAADGPSAKICNWSARCSKRNRMPRTVELTNISGITVKEMDWKPLIKDLKPEIDPLAASYRRTNTRFFFPSFQALTEMMDEADTNGTPVLQIFEPRSEDMDSRGRYQKQLCLGLSEIARRPGAASDRQRCLYRLGPVLADGNGPWEFCLKRSSRRC